MNNVLRDYTLCFIDVGRRDASNASVATHLRQHHVDHRGLRLARRRAYAAATIDSADVVNESLQSADLRDGVAVRSSDVRDDRLPGGGLAGQDIKEGTLATVPSARIAVDAYRLNGKDSSQFLGKNLVVRQTTKEVPAGGDGTDLKVCEAGEVAVSGGVGFGGDIRVSAPFDDPSTVDPKPIGWQTQVHNPETTGSRELTTYVVCGS